MSFQMRTTCPSNNKYYIRQVNGGWNGAIQGKPTRSGANVLSNCVGYANGRYAEIQNLGYIKYQLVCNAENFIEKAKAYGLTISSTPKLGGIMVWQKGSLSSGDGAGHVAIVERIDSSNQIYTSESAYGGTAFYNATRTNSNGRWGMGSAYSFRGCIVNPAVTDTPTPTPSGNERIRGIQQTLNARYNTGLVTDGIYGPATHKAIVKGLQTELNKQCGARLVIDGIFGSATKSACPNLKVGMSGNITWLVQAMLYIKGYSLSIDGIYGSDTRNKVIAFQKANGLSADGICGKNTFEKLFK